MGAVREKGIAKIHSSYAAQQEKAELATARKRKLLFRRMSLLLVFVVTVSYFMVSSYVSQAASINAKKAQLKQAGQQLSDLKKQQDNLKQEIKNLNNDDYIAKLARKEYFFSDKGEIIFNIPGDKQEK